MKKYRNKAVNEQELLAEIAIIEKRIINIGNDNLFKKILRFIGIK